MNKQRLLKQLENIEKNDPTYNATINFNLEKAKKAIENGKEDGVLSGMSFLQKDIINVQGEKTTGSSKMLKDYVSPYTATIHQKLIDAGAIYFGKVNLDEFAMGIDTSTSSFGATLNPLNTEHSVGGSSGGSAAAVAANFADFSIGTDTGGSIRLPAAYCGLVGMRPTYGTVSRYGIIPMGNSFDQAGPITKGVKLNHEVLKVIIGKDEKDMMSIEHPKGLDYALNENLKNYKVAYLDDLESICDKEIFEKYTNSINQISKQCKVVEPIKISELKYAPYAYYILCSSEVFSNYARYDGIKYGPKANSNLPFLEGVMQIRTENFGYEIKKRILQGAHFLAEENYENYYLRAAKYRTLIIQKMKKIFEEYDLIITPTTLVSAPTKGQKISPEKLFVSDMLTALASISNMPALSIPNGKISNNLYSSLQIVGNYFEESKIYNLAFAIESEEN